MDKKASTKPGGTGTNLHDVHERQRALVHFAALHPAGEGARHQRLALNGTAMADVRAEIEVEVVRAMEGGLPASRVAARAAMAAERAFTKAVVAIERPL